MNPVRWPASIVIAILLTAGAGLSADAPLPVIDGREIVASVNGVPITLDAFAHALARAHMGAVETEQAVPRQDPDALLDRLIGVELVVQEAENIGLDELPRVRDAIDDYRMQAVRKLVLARRAGQAIEHEAQRVERLYLERVKEVRVASIMVNSEEEALAARSRVESGEDFATLAREAMAAGTANPNDPAMYVKFSELRPHVRDAVSGLTPGQVSSVIRVKDQFTLVQLIDTRFPDDPALRAETERMVKELERENALRQYAESLREQYTTVDEELFGALDYTADGPGLESMRSDERIVATVEGGEPVTVAELTRALEKKAFHGAERAVEQGKFDNRKHPILEDLLKKRAIDLEAERLDVVETEEYRAMVDEHRKSLLFRAFLERAIDSKIKIEKDELERYLAEHVDNFSTPEMIRLDSIAFALREDAELALDKLNRGADFEWMRANAEGQVALEDDPGLLRFDGKMPIVTTALPRELRTAVAGAKTGQVRFYAASNGPSYVLIVRDVVPSRPQEFDTVKSTVLRKVAGLKRQAAFDEWVAALREASEIEVFGSSADLLQALGMAPAGHD